MARTRAIRPAPRHRRAYPSRHRAPRMAALTTPPPTLPIHLSRRRDRRRQSPSTSRRPRSPSTPGGRDPRHRDRGRTSSCTFGIVSLGSVPTDPVSSERVPRATVSGSAGAPSSAVRTRAVTTSAASTPTGAPANVLATSTAAGRRPTAERCASSPREGDDRTPGEHVTGRADHPATCLLRRQKSQGCPPSCRCVSGASRTPPGQCRDR